MSNYELMKAARTKLARKMQSKRVKVDGRKIALDDLEMMLQAMTMEMTQDITSKGHSSDEAWAALARFFTTAGGWMPSHEWRTCVRLMQATKQVVMEKYTLQA